MESGAEVWIVVADVFLGFLAVVLLLSIKPVLRLKNLNPTVRSKELEAPLKESLRACEQELKKYKIKVAELEHELEALKGLRSHQRPTCKEKGLASGNLFDAIVLGADQLKIGATTYDVDDLEDIFANPIAIAEKQGCVQTVRVSCERTIDAAECISVERALAKHFIVELNTAP
ncbi:MAG TPA: hypothetical protein VMA09_06250 [Candidatus Binataceae bacterium]|nr:hypothetical protein [Candidatus Binataceae bacterium]